MNYDDEDIRKMKLENLKFKNEVRTKLNILKSRVEELEYRSTMYTYTLIFKVILVLTCYYYGTGKYLKGFLWKKLERQSSV